MFQKIFCKCLSQPGKIFQCYFMNCRIRGAAQPSKSSGGFGEVANLHEAPSMNLTDEYSYEKFTHDLLQLIGMLFIATNVCVLYDSVPCD